MNVHGFQVALAETETETEALRPPGRPPGERAGQVAVAAGER